MKIKLLLLPILYLLSTSSYAGIIVPPPIIPPPAIAAPIASKPNADTENRVYAGLIWTLKDKTSWIPDLTFGFRSLRVKSSNSVNGGDVSARIKLYDGVAFDSVVLSYVGGKRDILGNLGLGYSFTNSSFLGALDAQGAYTRIGSDFQFNDKKFIPHLEILTVDKPNSLR